MRKTAPLLLVLIVLHSLVLCRSTDSDQPLVHKNNCTNATDFENAIQFSNVESLLQSLITVSLCVGFHNNTAGNPPDTFHGHFLCRGDVSGHACQSCIKKAKMEIAEECSGKKEAILWFDYCLSLLLP
ncbi:hypothetical protein MLD38_036751 [Melastoma candidum]|uniref:Uncharacterized protein n=1 Tax=Melastoma candidum TaxID=119954 RepID=A0ACB9LLN3_9MYRT|nr:hypothetical protein MLD38_036751 [Melastoma candidum]